MKVSAIINPVSGGGYASEIYGSILEEFREFDLTHHLTKYPGHATELAREALNSGADYILCIGGDGTLNEVIQEIVHSSVAIIPVSAGTGSDFVRNTGFSDLNAVKDAMLEHSVRDIDLGVVRQQDSDRYFLNILEIGFGAAVMDRVNHRKKVRGGSSFVSSVLSLIPSFKPYPVVVEINGETIRLDLAEMVVANGKWFGGGMLAAPSADLTDEMFDVHIVSGIGKFKLLTKLGKLRNGSYIDDPYVTSYRTDSLIVSGDAPVEIDGENIGSLPVEISMEKASLKVLFPKL